VRNSLQFTINNKTMRRDMTNPTPNSPPTLPFQIGGDTDTQETREWMDALSAVIEAEGPERAHFLLEQLLEHARQKSIDMPFSATTGYVNTIETEQQEHAPGN
jgi:pyruvate dehydrogenase E1 component